MTTEDERLKRDSVGDGRRSREVQDRVLTEDRVVTDDERLEMFRNSMFNDALPDLPKLPGYHVCWLTTQNPRDPIHRRMQIGYEPIRPDEVPGMIHASIKTGEWAGHIGVNEMLAFKIREDLYQRMMQEVHHDAPAREAAKLTETADFLREQAERDGGALIEGEGISDLRRGSPARGVFAD